MATVEDRNGGIYTSDYTTLSGTISGATNVIINSQAKYICVSAFNNCTNTLVSFSFQENPNLIEIRNNAFSGCIKLQTIDLRVCQKLTTIGASSFSGCKSCTNLYLPSSLTTLGDSVFKNLNIASIDLPENLQSIPSNCFYGATSLTTINIPIESRISSIGKWFGIYVPLTIFTITKNVISISDAAFELCKVSTISVSSQNNVFYSQNGIVVERSTLTAMAYPWGKTDPLIIPDNINAIKDSAFSNCQFTSVTFPQQSLTKIGSYAFRGTPIITIEIPDTVSVLGVYAFSSCSKLTKVKLPNSIKSLPDYCFYSTNISNIVLPNTITTLYSFCFVNCPNLKEITLPDSLKSLNGKVFDDTIEINFGDNSNLYIDSQFLIIDKQNTTISQYLGENSKNININIPYTVTTIKKGAFKDKNLISKIIFPVNSMLETIETEVFSNCNNLQFISLPTTTIKSLGASSFYCCYKLTEFVSGILTSIGKSCFYSCINLNRVQIHESLSLSVLPNSCFSQCSSISTITLPINLNSIEESCFMDCISLSEVVFPAKLNSLADSCFSNCSLTKVDLFKCTSLTVISNNAFNSNFNLELVILPPNLDKIGRYAFSGSAITNLSLPNSVSILDQFSFMNCKQLSLFSIPQNSQLTTIGVGVFKGCVSIETISSESSSFSIVTGALFDSHQTNTSLCRVIHRLSTKALSLAATIC